MSSGDCAPTDPPTDPGSLLFSLPILRKDGRTEEVHSLSLLGCKTFNLRPHLGLVKTVLHFWRL